MFTGIIESIGIVSAILKEGTNIHFTIESKLATELKVDQSLAHNGVCLTVTEINGGIYKVTAVAETLAKTNLGEWQKDDEINLERSLRVGDRLDGHFVQGHVDCTAICTDFKTLEGSWLFRFHFPEQFAALIIEKGSICVNGVSLTIFDVAKDEFTVTIIPYTFVHTNFHTIQKGNKVNIEFDVMGKYLLRRSDLL